MKTILLTIVAAIALTQTAQAEYRIGGDQTYTFLSCQGLENRPDRSVSVELTEGGIAGLTEMTVTFSSFGQVSTHKYIVTERRSKHIGGSTSYIGRGARLTVNYTTTPMQDGGLHAVLVRESRNARYMPIELSCHPMAQTM